MAEDRATSAEECLEEAKRWAATTPMAKGKGSVGAGPVAEAAVAARAAGLGAVRQRAEDVRVGGVPTCNRTRTRTGHRW